MRKIRLSRNLGGPADRELAPPNLSAESPATYLRAEARLVSYWPSQDFESLRDWLTSDEASAARLVIGPAGTGKTRLALEFSDHATRQAWRCVWVPAGQEQEAAHAARVGTSPVLLIVDYAETRSGLSQFLSQTLRGPAEPRLRVLLLARRAGEWWQRVLADCDSSTAGLVASSGQIVLGPLCAAADESLAFQQAVAAFAAKLGVAKPRISLPAGLTGETPLVVHAQALLAVLAVLSVEPRAPARSSRARPQADRAQILDQLLIHEASYWQHSLAKTDLALGPELTRKIIAAATLVGADDEAAATGLLAAFTELDEPARRGQIAAWLHELYPTGEPGTGYVEWIGPLRPDLLAETLIVKVLTEAPDLIPPLVAALPDYRTYRALTILARAGLAPGRTASGRPDAHQIIRSMIEADPGRLAFPLMTVAIETDPALGDLLARLADEQDWPLELVERIARALPETSVALAEVAAVVLGRLADATTGDPRARGKHLILLASQLSALGRREAAVAAIDAAIAGYRQVPADKQGAFRADLATALNNQSAHLGLLGRREESLAAADQAVAIFRELADGGPEIFKSGLATALNNRAARLAELGRREDALAAADEAVAACRQIAAGRQVAAGHEEPERAGLARALHNQSRSRFDLGQREEALAAGEEALDIYRELAAASPDAYRPSLASSLNNQSSFQAAAGRLDDAVATIDETIAAYRALGAIHPAAYRHHLANALSNSSVFLIDLDRPSPARLAADEAVSIYRPLQAQEPGAFTADFAIALNNQSRCLSSLGLVDDALEVIDEVIRIYRQLAADLPDPFGSGLALALSNQSVCLAKLGMVDRALRVTREAITTYSQLAADGPDAFLPDLAMVKNNESMYLTMLGRPDEALITIDEALEIRRRLFEASPAAFAGDLFASLNVKAEVLAALGRHADARQLQAEANRLRAG